MVNFLNLFLYSTPSVNNVGDVITTLLISFSTVTSQLGSGVVTCSSVLLVRLLSALQNLIPPQNCLTRKQEQLIQMKKFFDFRFLVFASSASTIFFFILYSYIANSIYWTKWIITLPATLVTLGGNVLVLLIYNEVFKTLGAYVREYVKLLRNTETSSLATRDTTYIQDQRNTLITVNIWRLERQILKVSYT